MSFLLPRVSRLENNNKNNSEKNKIFIVFPPLFFLMPLAMLVADQEKTKTLWLLLQWDSEKEVGKDNPGVVVMRRGSSKGCQSSYREKESFKKRGSSQLMWMCREFYIPVRV